KKIAEAAGKRDEAESFIAGSLKRVVPSVKDHIFRFLHDRKAVIQADPYMADGMLSLLDECGISSAKTMILGEKTGLPEAVLKRLEEKSAVFEPTISESGDIFPEKEDFDILMAPSLFPRFPRIASWIPFGYPNYFSHPVNPAPFLGYDGFIWWIERLTEAAQGRDTRAGGAAFRDFSGKD
ncbi:MAG: hypothetical protein FJ088_06940, partial [Deltaproteobacteria bacterium]|nr:hypothetical protein [Deltaproteobacteria bacterium]